MSDINLREVEFTHPADSPITIGFSEGGYFHDLVTRGIGYILDGNIIERYTKHRTGIDKVKSYTRTYELSIIGLIKDLDQIDCGSGLVCTKLKYIPNNKHPVFRKPDVHGVYNPSLLFNPAIDKNPIITGIVIEYESVAVKVEVVQDLPEIKKVIVVSVPQKLPELTESEEVAEVTLKEYARI
jgi:hypothetical protein